MKTVILFGGGDGGGLMMTALGVQPIPPFDAGVLQTLKSTAALVNAVTAAHSDAARKKMATLALSLSNLSVELVERVVGPLDPERAIVFQDKDAGFSCGSTGKPPIPLPWPPRSLPSASELLAAGAIETDLIDFLGKAREAKANFTDLFENPEALAKTLGFTLCEKSANDLKMLAPSKLAEITDDTDREVVGFFHKVVEDGRYMETWYTEPYEISQTLQVTLSEAAIERIVTRGPEAFISLRMSTGKKAIAAGIVFAVVCIVIGTVLTPKYRAIDEIVTDRSGLEKF